MFEVVIARNDSKIEHLGRDPRAILLIFEAAPPFRGIRVDGSVELVPDDGATARLAIASRYLGPERGRAYADPRPPAARLRHPLADRHRHGLGSRRQAALTVAGV